MKSLSKNERKNRQYYEKLLTKEHVDLKISVIQDPDRIEAEMPLVRALHWTQWRAQRRLGYFTAWPQARLFNYRLASELSKFGRTRVIKITAGSTPIIYEYYYIFGNMAYWQVSGRAIGQEWDRYSLGSTGALIMIRKIMEERIFHIEGGVSHYDYKTRLGAKDLNLSVLRIIAPGPVSKLKYHVFRLFCILFEKIYYKFWYQRIQPKLPFFMHRPIWVSYIRSIF
jgi:hypothetical protein